MSSLLSVWTSDYDSICSSVFCLSVFYLTICSSICLSVHLSCVCPSISSLCFHPSICPSAVPFSLMLLCTIVTQSLHYNFSHGFHCLLTYVFLTGVDEGRVTSPNRRKLVVKPISIDEPTTAQAAEESEQANSPQQVTNTCRCF